MGEEEEAVRDERLVSMIVRPIKLSFSIALSTDDAGDESEHFFLSSAPLSATAESFEDAIS